MKNESEFITNTSIMSVSTYVSYIFTVLTGIVIAKVLGPASFGVYSALMLVVTYSIHANLGLFHGMSKKIPFLRGKNEVGEIKKTENTGLIISLAIIILIGIAIFISSFFMQTISEQTREGMRIVALLIIPQQLFYYYQHYYRSHKRFDMMSRVTLVYSSIYLITIAAVNYNLNVTKVFIAMFVAFVAAVAYARKKDHVDLSFKLNAQYTLNLIRSGFPLLVLAIIGLVFTSLDKILIIKLLDNTQMGYYSFSAIIAGIILLVPTNIGQVLFPSIIEKYSEKEKKEDIKNYLLKPILVISYLLPLMIGSVFIISRTLIEYLLPKYIPGIIALYILVCSNFFISVIIPSQNFLVTLNKEKYIIKLQIASIVVGAVLNYVAIAKGYGITGVAAATALNFALFSISVMIITFREYHLSKKEVIKDLCEIYSPIIYIAAILFFIDSLNNKGVIFYDVAITLAKLIFFILINIPLIWWANKRTGVVKLFINIIKAGRLFQKQ